MIAIGGLHVSCKRLWSSKMLKWISFNNVGRFDRSTEDLQLKMACKVKTQEITGATNALT